jgi:hypothetical protein
MFGRANRRLTGASTRIAAIALSFVALLDLSTAGRSYVYCASMQTVMAYACCAHSASDASTDAVLSNRAICCHSQEIGSLDAGEASADRIQVTAARVAAVAAPQFDRATRTSLTLATVQIPIMRAPPHLQTLARRVVLQV